MSAGNRSSLVLFALVVLLALGAVAWLVLSGGPPAGPAKGTPPAPAVRKTSPEPAVVPPVPGPEAGKRPPREPRVPVVLEIRGTVLGPTGAPEEGADVVVLQAARTEGGKGPPTAPPAEEKVDAESLRELFALTVEEAATVSWYSGIPAPPAAEPPAREMGRVRSGADGSFVVPVKSRGPFRVEGAKEGVGTAVADGILAGAAPLTLKLGGEQALRGRVVQDAGNGPVEGAVVVARAGRIAGTARSAADGSFTLPGLPPGRYSVTAGAAGFAPTVVASVESPATEPVEIRLGLGRAVRVSVTRWDMTAMRGRKPGSPEDGGGRPPVEGALVVLYQRSTDTFRAGTTGPDGIVRVDRLGPGTWELAARKEGHCVGIGRAIKIGPASPPEESRDIKLLPLEPTPLVIRSEDGAPLRNAAIYTGGEDEEFDARRSRLLGRTDDQGRITVAFDDAVPWKAVAWVVPEDGGAVVRVEADEPGEEQKVLVPRGRVVQGTVKDQRGKALAAAEVTLIVVNDELEIDIELRAASDATGAFRFPTVPFGEVTIEVETADGDIGDLDVDGENRESPLVRDVVVEVFE